MTYLNRLITGVVEKNIMAKRSYGNYSIDIKYGYNRVSYNIFKNGVIIFSVLNNNPILKKLKCYSYDDLTRIDFKAIIKSLQSNFSDHEICWSDVEYKDFIKIT